MGKLNIAHHKSYHPYRRDNIERVRKDEEEARQREAIEEGRMLLADSEARIDLLRQRAGLQGSKGRQDRDPGDLAVDSAREASTSTPAGPSTITSSSGHINFFEDLERQGMAVVPVRSAKKDPPLENERGVALAPSAKDLNPWYSDRSHAESSVPDDGKRTRDLARKSVHDPLTSINSKLALRNAPAPHASSRVARSRTRPPSAGPVPPGGANVERMSRESAERQRAIELIKRKKRESEGRGGETPSTVRGGGYGDVFNRREIEEVQWAKRHGRDGDSDRHRDRHSRRER